MAIFTEVESQYSFIILQYQTKWSPLWWIRPCSCPSLGNTIHCKKAKFTPKPNMNELPSLSVWFLQPVNVEVEEVADLDLALFVAGQRATNGAHLRLKSVEISGIWKSPPLWCSPPHSAASWHWSTRLGWACPSCRGRTWDRSSRSSRQTPPPPCRPWPDEPESAAPRVSPTLPS